MAELNTLTTGSRPIIPFGDVQIDTAQSKFGGASALFDGTGDYLNTPDSDDWNYGTGKFTIDFWVRFNSVASFCYFYSQSSAADNFFDIYWTTNNRLNIAHIQSGVWQVDYYIPFTPSTDTWYHIELSKDGTAAGDWHTFIDGVEGTKTVVTGLFNTTMADIPAVLKIGEGTSTGDINGWMDEFRVSKGVARHTTGFTPETSAYSTDAYTKLLLHFDGTDASTTFTDSSGVNYSLLADAVAYYRMESGALTTDTSGNGFTLTNVNTVAEATGKYGGGADGGATNSTKYLWINNNLGIDGGACSISLWVKMNTEIGSGIQTFVSQQNTNTDTSFMITYDYNGGTRRIAFRRYRQGVAADENYYTITLGTSAFQHLVLTYDATNLRGYVNGTLQAGPTAFSGNGTGVTSEHLAILTNKGGAGTPSEYVSAIVDDVAIFNRVLTASEVTSLYEATASSSTSLEASLIMF
jgi:hypothetical protein